MIVGLGIDVCAIDRVRKSLERHGRRFAERVLTEAELAYCERHRDPAISFAGRFAAKEALIKALGGPPVLRFHDMIVAPAEGGPPRFELRGSAADAMARLGATHVHLSITHDAGVAAAVVILEQER